MGVFATRSPHRPNPIGLSIGIIEEKLGDILVVSGIDLVDKTPILDIKPYIAPDRVCEEERKIPEWLEETKSSTVEVEFSEEAIT